MRRGRWPAAIAARVQVMRRWGGGGGGGAMAEYWV